MNGTQLGTLGMWPPTARRHRSSRMVTSMDAASESMAALERVHDSPFFSSNLWTGLAVVLRVLARVHPQQQHNSIPESARVVPVEHWKANDKVDAIADGADCVHVEAVSNGVVRKLRGGRWCHHNKPQQVIGVCGKACVLKQWSGSP